MRVKCLAQEHNTMSLVRAQTRTAQSESESTNHEATVSHQVRLKSVSTLDNILQKKCTKDVSTTQ